MSFTGRAMRALHRFVAVPLLEFTLPTDCFACHSPLTGRQLRGACADCWTRFRIIRPPFCASCGDPIPEATDILGPANGRCPSCVLRPPLVARVRSAVVYDDCARAFVLRGKVGLRPDVLTELGTRLGSVLAADGFTRSCDVVIPVPSHPWVRVRRGFDPAQELARGVSTMLGLPLRPRWLRRRWRRVVVAKRLPGRDRWNAVRDAFRARGAVRGLHVLLVDDVRTTGATLSASARALLAAGAGEVRAAVWAATPRTGMGPGVPGDSHRL